MPIKKGDITNPLGAKARHKDVKRIKLMTHQQIAEMLQTILENDVDALQKLVVAKGTSVFKVWVASVAMKAIREGNDTPLWAITDRIVGKPKQGYSEIPEIPLSEFAHMTLAEKLAEANRLRAEREAIGEETCLIN